MSDAHAIRPPYLDPEARRARVAELAESIDAEPITIGASVDGEAITAVRVPARAQTADAKVVCVANIHGIEWIGGLVALGLLERLGSRDREVDALRERAEVWLVPCLNPDGYRRTWEAGGRGRLVDLRTNARGVDLNRNFPLPPGMRRLALPGAGSQKPGDGTYCGPSPLSEPETLALHELCDAQRFHAAIGMHSFMGTMIHARVQTKAAWQTYGALCGAFAGAQPQRRYRRLASRFFDAWTGEQEDHLHHGHDCWAMCIETFAFTASLGQHLRAPTKFWRFNPYDPQPWIANDVPGLLAYFTAALDRPRPSKLG